MTIITTLFALSVLCIWTLAGILLAFAFFGKPGSDSENKTE